MSKKSTSSRWSVWITTPVLLSVAVLIAWAGGSQTRPPTHGLPMIVLGWVVFLNAAAWIPAYLTRSERFYDLVGSLSFISSLVLVGWLSQPGMAGWIMMAIVLLWTSRMAWFLVGRIRQQGKDGRFDTIKTDPVRFLNAWMMQALWAFLCLLPLLVRQDIDPDEGFSALCWAGLGLWVFGFLIEVISDEQKRTFRRRNPGGTRFIQSGLWSISRHPNYVGEILLWTGFTVMALPVVSGWLWVVLITPVFVYSLLRFVSGVSLLEARSDAKWGGNEDYEAYKRRTPVLFPLPWLRG